MGLYIRSPNLPVLYPYQYQYQNSLHLHYSKSTSVFMASRLLLFLLSAATCTAQQPAECLEVGWPPKESQRRWAGHPKESLRDVRMSARHLNATPYNPALQTDPAAAAFPLGARCVPRHASAQPSAGQPYTTLDRLARRWHVRQRAVHGGETLPSAPEKGTRIATPMYRGQAAYTS